MGFRLQVSIPWGFAAYPTLEQGCGYTHRDMQFSQGKMDPSVNGLTVDPPGLPPGDEYSVQIRELKGYSARIARNKKRLAPRLVRSICSQPLKHWSLSKV